MPAVLLWSSAALLHQLFVVWVCPPCATPLENILSFGLVALQVPR